MSIREVPSTPGILASTVERMPMHGVDAGIPDKSVQVAGNMDYAMKQFLGGENDGVSVGTGIQNVKNVMRHAKKIGRPDIVAAGSALLSVYNKYGTDPDGTATSNFFSLLPK